MASAEITQIYRYPVKGLSAQALKTAVISKGKSLAFDRAFAIENGSGGFDPAAPAYLPKNKFLMLMSHERLASLETEFDDTECRLTIKRNGKQVATGRLDDRLGRQLVEQFLSAYMSAELRGAPRVVHAPGHVFSDTPAKVISLINLASVRDLERVVGKPVDPMRFRANIYVDGLDPWEEFTWLGRRVSLNGQDIFHCTERIERCAATDVDPVTGKRDMSLPHTLLRAFDHMDMGVYLEATEDTSATAGDQLASGEIQEL